MGSLKRLFGFSVEEDPLKGEIEEMRRAAKIAVKEAERAGKLAGKRARASKRSEKGGEEPGGLSKAVEEMETIFSEIEGFGG